MKRAYHRSSYAKPYEEYCREKFPSEAERIFDCADAYYRSFVSNMPDIGKNMMAANMLDWFTILSFFEASDRRLGGEELLTIKRRAVERLAFLGKLVDGNKSRWPYKLFEKVYVRYDKKLKRHRARGKWTCSWQVEINPEQRTEGFAFRLIGCPIATHARENGYTELLPYLCKTDHFLAELMHTRLIRTQTEALGGDYSDYWYVGDKSPVLENYKGLKQI